jgi:hypothetical protein
MRILIFSANFFLSISCSKKNWARYDKKCLIGLLHVKYPSFSSDFNVTWIFSTDFWKLHINFHENPSSGRRVVPCEQTDMTKLIVAFRNFANAPKTSQLLMYREIIAVCSQIHTKHTNTLCGQSVGVLMLNLVADLYTITKGLYTVKWRTHFIVLQPHGLKTSSIQIMGDTVTSELEGVSAVEKSHRCVSVTMPVSNHLHCTKNKSLQTTPLQADQLCSWEEPLGLLLNMCSWYKNCNTEHISFQIRHTVANTR